MSDQPQPRILVVDDSPQNVRVLEAVLVPRGYEVLAASSGMQALQAVGTESPDLVLLDVLMPEMDGYEVCRRLRAQPATAFLPIVMITASGDQERVQAVEAGADDFVQKPFNQAELLSRIRSLLRIKTYHDTVRAQAAELAEWNRTLEVRVQSQLAELERLGRLRRFLPAHVANVLVSADGESLLETHRRQIAVVSCRLSGFAELAETSAPEELIGVLAEYYAAVGGIVSRTDATVGPLNADELLMFFNDPLTVEAPAREAARLALEVREHLAKQVPAWRRLGYDIGFGMGIDLGYATLGILGLEGRTEYGAIGPVVHIASCLRDAAEDGQILITQRVLLAAEEHLEATRLGETAIRGLKGPTQVFALAGLGAKPPRAGGPAVETRKARLTAREREVVALLARGYTNRQIAEALVVAEPTAVRHVANILNKLDMGSRAQVAVWAVREGLAPAGSAP